MFTEKDFEAEYEIRPDQVLNHATKVCHARKKGQSLRDLAVQSLCNTGKLIILIPSLFQTVLVEQ